MCIVPLRQHGRSTTLIYDIPNTCKNVLQFASLLTSIQLHVIIILKYSVSHEAVVVMSDTIILTIYKTLLERMLCEMIPTKETQFNCI